MILVSAEIKYQIMFTGGPQQGQQRVRHPTQPSWESKLSASPRVGVNNITCPRG